MSGKHDPREIVRGLQQILISDKKRIGFLFGAGTSFATGISDLRVPSVMPMTDQIVASIIRSAPNLKLCIDEIKAEIGSGKFHVETFLSNVEGKRSVIGGGKLNGLDKAGFDDLSEKIRHEIADLVSIHKALLAEKEKVKALAHVKFSEWVNRASRAYPTEIFTTNYDYLFEIALEYFGVPYFDGFSGAFRPFFCPEAVEDLHSYSKLTKLWKLHGSLGWEFDGERRLATRGGDMGSNLLIYPSHLKYNDSRKHPYVALIDRLCSFLQQDDAVLITCGYSFGDEHLNERISTSLRRGFNSHVFALYYDKLSADAAAASYRLADEHDHVRRMAVKDTAGKMSVFGIRGAVVGGVYGTWELKTDLGPEESELISCYFKPDPGDAGAEKIKRTGDFVLPDFVSLSSFLRAMTSSASVEGGVL